MQLIGNIINTVFFKHLTKENKMGIFTHHSATSSNAHPFHMGADETKNQTASSTSQGSSSSDTSSASSSRKSACGCGCSHKTKPVDDEVLEIKEEEWDY